MDQNRITNNQNVDDDLQKAIDSITNTTNIDPVFSDPVAAPSSVPEGDTGELGEPVGPFPEPKIEAPAPVPEPAPAPIAPSPSEALSMHQVKEAALRDLIPLLDRLSMNASQKFDIYRNIFEELKDYTVLDPAYRAASEIPDDTERAEALFYLVKTIDNM